MDGRQSCASASFDSTPLQAGTGRWHENTDGRDLCVLMYVDVEMNRQKLMLVVLVAREGWSARCPAHGGL